MNKFVEILAPAGSDESLKAAVRAGADAVYFGAKDFNARRNADNFSNAELREAIGYCRERGISCYLTLNISLKDDELESALQTAALAFEAGITAFIVSDLGLASQIKQNLPGAVLHGSTQLSVHSPAALPALKKMGFSRIVVAREMSKTELRAFCKKAEEYQIEVEAFVHGALCMSISGQCYMSALLGSRSGNRGLCAGPCRLPFSANDTARYDLSLKDLSLIHKIPELIECGVCSLKIEGRMKRPEYVAAAVHTCRSVCNGIETDIPDLRRVFSRSGFTDGYFSENRGSQMFGVRTKEDAATPDLLAKLHTLYRAERQCVPVSAKLTVAVDRPIVLTLSDGVHTTTKTGEIVAKAQSHPADHDSLKSKIQKLGSTPYYLTDFSCDISGDCFVSAAALNLVKNECVAALSEARRNTDIQPIDIAINKPMRKQRPEKFSKIARFNSLSGIPSNLSGIDAIILPSEEISKGFSVGIPIIAELPRGSFEDQITLRQLKNAKANGAIAALCSNLSHFELAKSAGLPAVSSFSMNIFNSSSACAVEELGATAHLLSFEPTSKVLSEIASDKPSGIIIYGRLPLMLTRNCPIANSVSCISCGKNRSIKDRMGASFPIRCRNGCSEVLNSVPLWLADKSDIFSDFSFGVFWFTIESAAEAAEVLRAYEDKQPCKDSFTRGLYLRGIE